MNQDLIILILIIAGAVVFFLLRRSSEMPASKQPTSEPMTGWPSPQTENRTDLVLITHPLIRKAAERVWDKGGEAAKYVARDGDNIYLSFDRIEDPVQRQKALDLITSIQAGQDVDMSEFMQLVRRMLES